MTMMVLNVSSSSRILLLCFKPLLSVHQQEVVLPLHVVDCLVQQEVEVAPLDVVVACLLHEVDSLVEVVVVSFQLNQCLSRKDQLL